MHSQLLRSAHRKFACTKMIFFAFLLLASTGCQEGIEISGSSEAPSSRKSQQQNYSPPTALAGSGGATGGYLNGGPPSGGGSGYGGKTSEAYGGGYGGDGKSQAAGEESLASTDRKIIYQTDISLVVKEYQSFEASLPKLVELFHGFVAKSASNRLYQNQQSGHWVVRIPVASYVEFLTGINGLGFAESRQEDAQDVTDQFVDIDARIRNSKRLEERIIKMVDERAGKMSDVLEIERELSRVRQDIERMEGQLRVISDRSAMATVTIRCREEKEYSPPAAPTYVSRLQASWGKSIGSLVDFFGNGFIALVAGIPWFVTFCTPMAIGILYVRRRLIKRKITKSTRAANTST